MKNRNQQNNSHLKISRKQSSKIIYFFDGYHRSILVRGSSINWVVLLLQENFPTLFFQGWPSSFSIEVSTDLSVVFALQESSLMVVRCCYDLIRLDLIRPSLIIYNYQKRVCSEKSTASIQNISFDIWWDRTIARVCFKLWINSQKLLNLLMKTFLRIYREWRTLRSIMRISWVLTGRLIE